RVERGERFDVSGERREERGEKREKLSRSEKEALVYAKEKVERAQGFIEAVKQRRRTLYITMKAIVEIQHKYFQDGDESDLQPMILKDVADRTGLDISTISRVSNMKYAQTRWGTFKLRHFFSDSYRTESGEEMSTRRIKAALQEIVEAENKKHPLNDDALKVELTKRGFPIARRTISKYREQLGIPVARLRKN
ncbi:MAG: RNA polymerase sigma-54 factor, partial [Prevotella sp.]|nr:RNA polymerase sigma-54 factor [Prevotella sp.]